MGNKYYILATGQLNILERNEIVQSLETVRYNLAGNKFVCKTKIGTEYFAFMNPNTELTHAEVLIEMAKPTWTLDTEI